MNLAIPVRVVGCGSPHGDDAVGWEVIRSLRHDARTPNSVELHAVDGGQGLLDRLDGRGTLLLVDAVAPGVEPGKVYRLEWPDDRLQALRPGTTHQLRPAESLALAATLGLLPPRVIVFGIEAADVGTSAHLSKPVNAAVPAVVERILEILGHARDVAATRINATD